MIYNRLVLNEFPYHLGKSTHLLSGWHPLLGGAFLNFGQAFYILLV